MQATPLQSNLSFASFVFTFVTEIVVVFFAGCFRRLLQIVTEFIQNGELNQIVPPQERRLLKFSGTSALQLLQNVPENGTQIMGVFGVFSSVCKGDTDAGFVIAPLEFGRSAVPLSIIASAHA